MAVKLYGAYYAPNANRALVVLHEKEVEFELVPVITLNGDQKKPEYMALQPFGVIPLLQDGDVQLWESRAITRFIADKYQHQGTPNLHGATPAERAQVEQWLEVESGTFSPLMRELFRQLFYIPGIFNKLPDEKAVAEAETKLARVLDVYEARLAESEYLAGEGVSIAELAHLGFAYPYFEMLGRRELLRSRARVAAWWAALCARPAWPAWQQVVALAAPVYGPWLERVHACLASAAKE